MAVCALVAALALGAAGAAAAAVLGATLWVPIKPPICAQVPDRRFQAAATNILALCPNPDWSPCFDDCVSALNTVSPTADDGGSGSGGAVLNTCFLPRSTAVGHTLCAAPDAHIGI